MLGIDGIDGIDGMPGKDGPGIGDTRHRGAVANAGLVIGVIGAPERHPLAKNYTPFLDLLILLQTLRVVLWPEGAR